jgi:hypothetical protein
MRRIKDASALSYNGLASKTHYSRSSWERFLNGKQIPTRVAVEQFAAAAGEDPARLLTLLEAAVKRDCQLNREALSARAATVMEESAAQPPSPTGDTASEAPASERSAALAFAPAASEPGSSGKEAPGAGSGGHTKASYTTTRFAWAGPMRTAAATLAGALLGSLVTLFAIEPADASKPATGSTAGSESGEARSSSHLAKPVKVGCRSDTCLRREPAAHDCHWDATTVRQTYLRGMIIQLRYSQACQAVWGRIENGNVGDVVTIRDVHGQTLDATIRMEHDTYTRMLAVTPEAPWATVAVCGAIPAQKEQECSPLGVIKPTG